MSENDFSKNFDAFLQMQNQYMDMWKTAGQKKPEPSSQNPWASVMNNFWSSMPGQNASFGPLSGPFSGDMNQQNLMMSQLTKCFESIVGATNKTGEQTPEQWQSFINQSLNDLQSQLMKSASAPFNSTPDVANLWGIPVSLWQQTMQPQNFSVPTGMAASPAADQTSGSAANMGPGLGPNREKYEKRKSVV